MAEITPGLLQELLLKVTRADSDLLRVVGAVRRMEVRSSVFLEGRWNPPERRLAAIYAQGMPAEISYYLKGAVASRTRFGADERGAPFAHHETCNRGGRGEIQGSERYTCSRGGDTAQAEILCQADGGPIFRWSFHLDPESGEVEEIAHDGHGAVLKRTLRKYSDDGLLLREKRDMGPFRDSTFSFDESGVLAEEQRSGGRCLTFKDYVFDQGGNWIQRQQVDYNENLDQYYFPPELFYRRIDYARSSWLARLLRR